MAEYRTGIGYDVHRLVAGRRCVLGGVTIEADVGPDGHSDADVVLHALCDALLGSVAAGDIGSHFPDTDARWKDADSRDLLREVVRIVHTRGVRRVVHADLTIVAEAPRIGPHVAAMRAVIASDLGIAADRVSVKATTHERLGAFGRGEGIAAMATATVEWEATA